MKILKKIVLILLITCILVTSMPIYALEKIVNGKEDWDNALHFIVRHWHSTYEENEDSQESVIVEGYIVPKGEKYAIYKVENGDKKELLAGAKPDSNYIDSFDPQNGKITLKANPLKHKDGTPLESFSAFSITSGNKSVEITDDDDGKVVISYHPYVHLVKIHTFYDNESLKVVGSGSDDAVFGSSETQTNAEQDVAWVYTYTKDDGTHHVGDVVKNNDQPVYKKENLPADCKDGDNVKLTKVYSTLEGLHTDKTANSVDENDREFTIDLETWYSGAKAADVGLVLDASGSMIFTSDVLEPIHLDEKQLKALNLEDKMLSKEKYEKGGPSTNAWNHDIFLTQSEVNEILNVHNTDNNPLGNSGYNYYVFNESTDVNEYAPLGYWDGSLNDELYDSLIGYYEFNKGNYTNTKDDKRRDWLKNSASDSDGEAYVVKQIEVPSSTTSKENTSFEVTEKPKDWSNENSIKMKTDKGLTVKDLNSSEGVETGLGVLLDAKPSTDNFTISFTVEKDKSETQPQQEADLIYIGPLENIESSDYYRVYRDEKTSSNRLKMDEISSNNKEGTKSSTKTNINSVFNETNKACTITIVFENGKIYSYKDGKKENDNNNQEIKLSEKNIVITGFDNNYSGSDLYIDNVCVFDTALSADEVKKISFSATEAEENEYLAYNTFEEDEKAKEVKAGETAGNGEEEKIGFTNKNFVDPVTGGMSGWYYINHDSNLDDHYFKENIQTGKILWGITKNTKDNEIVFTDTFKNPKGVKEEPVKTGLKYKPEENSPTLFYIDQNGYLCCFFTRGTKQAQTGTSFVYEKDDSEYIKAEALQRALGSFASELNEASPYSEISAVRYSSDKATEEEYDKFVLLDWTNDPTDVQDMMSLSYGTGGTTEGTESNHKSEDGKTIKQYNYGVTGGTATYVGLEAFEKFLVNRADRDSDKYLIIFTDGKDTSGEDKQKEITETVEKLKKQGYTIMAVMLTGGTIEYSTEDKSEYKEAKDFLLKLVGTSETENDKEEDKDKDKEQYFFSTAEVGLSDGEKSDREEADTIDRLTEIFTEDILERISDNLEAYNVQDYIDPRFNLISADGQEYKLDANGIVTILDTDGSIFAKCNLKNGTAEEKEKISIKEENESDKKYYLSVRLSDDSDVDIATRNARLYFDESNNMYYLKWVDQTIPGCIVNAKILPVWNTRFTIKAKEDVIGGNAVLTNGNKEKMNYVYNKEDNNASSGIDKWKHEKDDDSYVSKGFPRVAVNIPPSNKEKASEQTIYMGENLDYKTIEKEMIKEVSEDIKDSRKDIWYYWEYLERYAKNQNKTADEYIKDILDKKILEIPYYYLPDKDNTNLTENDEHKEDKLGKLVYKIEETGGNDGVVQDRDERELKLTVKYEPLNLEKSDEEKSEGETEETTDRSKENDKLVTENNYKWDKTYKPAVGKEQKSRTLIENKHDIKVVSGEVALQVILNRDILEILYDQPIQYEIDLYRTYNDKKEKVGTFKATYNSESDDASEPDKDGNVTVTAKLQYDEGYMTTNGLPLGTYTLENQQIKGLKNIKYDTINVVKDTARYVEELFKLGSGKETPKSYLAVLGNETNITLGKKADSKYLDERFGLFEVEPIAVFEMPDAGSNALIMHYIISGLCIVTATILHQSLKIRRKKRK